MNKLGKKVKDRITGFEGIAISCCEYVNGCIEYAVKPKVNKKGEMQEAEWVDDIQLEVIGDKRGVEKILKDEVIKKKKEFKPGGGHRSHPF